MLIFTALASAFSLATSATPQSKKSAATAEVPAAQPAAEDGDSVTDGQLFLEAWASPLAFIVLSLWWIVVLHYPKSPEQSAQAAISFLIVATLVFVEITVLWAANNWDWFKDQIAGTAALGPIGLMYLKELVAQYKSIGKVEANTNAQALAEEIAKRTSEARSAKSLTRLTWNDVHSLEIALLELQPVQDIERRAWSLREDYRQAVSAARYQAYLASDPPNSGPAVRDDLRRLLAELHRLRHLERTQNEVRASSVGWACGGFMVVATGAISAWLFLDWHLWPVALLGALGALFSVMRRSNSDDGASIGSLEMVPKWSVVLSPVIGAVAAVVLYFILRAQLLSGAMFPAFDARACGCVQLPTSGLDCAKLLVWAFISGFSEMFVPDALDWIARQGTPGKQDGGSAGLPPTPPTKPEASVPLIHEPVKTTDPTIQGSCGEPDGTVVQVLVDGKLINPAHVTGKQWSVTLASPLSVGQRVTARAIPATPDKRPSADSKPVLVS